MKTTVLSKIFAASFLAVAVLSCTPIGTDTSEEDEDKTENPANPANPENPGGPGESEDPGDSDEQEPPVVQDCLIRTISMTGTLNVSVDFSAEALSSSRLYVALPYPAENRYQDISDIRTDGKLMTAKRGDAYLTWYESFSSGSKVSRECEITFDYVTYSVSTDFSKITEIYPYDTSSDIYKNHTSSSGSYIVPSNSTIKTIASSIWEESADELDYARKCYEYVAENYRYLNPNTGIHTLQQNLRDGGGDCGNLSAIYISLLRNKKIPSRPVVCIRPDASFHVWSEFYLEAYGWIPVDVTYKNSDPRGDYFGTYPGDCIVVSNEYDLDMVIGNEDFDVPLLQTYAYWYWNMSGMKESYSIKKVK